ncbi:hypothetical protein PTSG_00082 [Salpingoeca rosetta]|uniref:VWFA domain-containing protein n=1 Tax=Salpingoeca rosetta (strain ATCC 50818 / BSB-021) TaxID=946362 RepID=F2TVG7_SALR5|nr:uncharacterized protein PTSG_00082 [Salpingoeca rosetta]EGD72063.1 hypothetical protein PTSG_00082 [Salpingoeca rosetta]WCF76183.1 voltage-gated calcium channel alpha2delta subunit A form [Salpingoeca rosetta]|eukprot:XP_004998635.1 hypothetical protein PTSG_00082 [Salpingoeca rosetta]
MRAVAAAGLALCTATVVLMVAVDVHGQTTLLNLLQAREQEVEQLATALRGLYDDAYCGSASCASDVAACESELLTSTCASTFGGCRSKTENRRLDFSSSVMRTASTPFDDDVRQEACWTRQLDNTFISINGGTSENTDTATKWQYVGTSSGFYRIYPGVPQQDCNAYDPRLRPWYVAATSGPKDIVIVLDRSGSMATNNRWETAMDAAETVLETLTIADFVAIVVFDTSASQVCGTTIPCGSLVQATADNVGTLRTLLANFNPDGSTNFESAFQVAFSVLKQTGERTSNCHTAILFMTDGMITAGLEGNAFLDFVDDEQDALEAAVGKRAVLFTFSFGTGADETIPKALACNHNGTWSPVEYNINLRQQMGNYYDYFASLRATTSSPVVWVEPYEDASGAGVLTTASKAVYDTRFSPARLIGVIGIDILASDLQDVAVDYEDLLDALVQRSNTCPTITLDRCELGAIRTTDYSTSGFPSQYTENDRLCDADELDGCSTTTNLPCVDDNNIYTPPSIPATEETHSHFGNSRSSYTDEACRSCSKSVSSGAEHTRVSAVVVVAALIALSMLAF